MIFLIKNLDLIIKQVLVALTWQLAPPIRDDWMEWCWKLLTMEWYYENMLVAISIKIDEFCFRNDEFCVRNDGFCI